MNGPEETLRQWMEERFDKLDQQMRDAVKELATEQKETRHKQQGAIDQIGMQVGVLVTQAHARERELAALQEWRGDGGALDQRFQRQSREMADDRRRVEDIQGWKNRVTGALGIIAFMFPATVGVIVALLR